MCVDPATLAIIAATTAAASTAYTGYTTVQRNKYEAKVADVNAVYADRQARDAQERGEQDLQAHYRDVAQVRARQQLGYAAAGVDTSFGSPADVMADTTVQGNLDAERVAAGTEGERQGFLIGAQNNRLQAAGSRAAAGAAAFSTVLETGSSLVSGAAGVGAAFGKYGAPAWTGKAGQAVQRAYTPKKF